MSSFEHGYSFRSAEEDENGLLPLESGLGGVYEEGPAHHGSAYPEWQETNRRLQILDLGPSDYRFDRSLGPDAAWEEQVFYDAADPKYVEQRESTGAHCMDDRVKEPGIQLPGGLLETEIADFYLNPATPEIPVSKAGKIVAAKLRKQGWPVWVHGDACAASLFKRQGLELAAYYYSAASDFNHEVMDALEVPYEEESFVRALSTGDQRARNDRLWDISAETQLEINSERPGISREDFTEPHKAAGLRIDVTDGLFNNDLFRQDHDGVGLLSVTPGAYLKELRAIGTPEDVVVRKMIALNIHTFGIAKAVGHQYLLAGIVKE